MLILTEFLRRHAESACEKQNEEMVEGFFDHVDMQELIVDLFGNYPNQNVEDIKDLVRYSFLAFVSDIDLRKSRFKFGHHPDVRSAVRDKYVKSRKEITSRLHKEPDSRLVGIANGAATLPEQLREPLFGFIEGDLRMSDMNVQVSGAEMENLFKGIGRIFSTREKRKDMVRAALASFSSE